MNLISDLRSRDLRRIWNLIFVPVLLAVVLLLFFHGHPHLATTLYLGSVLSSIAPLLIITAGFSFVWYCGGVDLSIGGQIFLIVISMSLAAGRQMPPVLILLTGAAVGFLCGCANGLLVAVLGVPSFVASFASSFAFTGIAKTLVTRGAHLAKLTDVPLSSIGVSLWHADFLIALAVLLLSSFLLNRTYWGRYMLAVGTNEPAARRVGLHIRRIQWSAYICSGLIYAVAAAVLFANEGLAITDADTELMLSAIAAVVLGNANIFRDEKKGVWVRILHAAAAVLLLDRIKIWANEMFRSAYVQQITTSVILLTAYAVDRRSRRRDRESSGIKNE